jgi:large subunit ribosomal protein L23
MADLKYYDIILKPVVTEKTMNDMADKKYTFYVNKDANKVQIKEAVEKMFEGVKVEYVNTMNLNGKFRRRGATSGYTAARKKAVVQLKSGSKEIELFQGL